MSSKVNKEHHMETSSIGEEEEGGGGGGSDEKRKRKRTTRNTDKKLYNKCDIQTTVVKMKLNTILKSDRLRTEIIKTDKNQGGFETFVRKSRHELLHCQKCKVWRNRDLSASETIKRLLKFRLDGERIPWVFRRGQCWEDVEDVNPCLQTTESNVSNLFLNMGRNPHV